MFKRLLLIALLSSVGPALAKKAGPSPAPLPQPVPEQAKAANDDARADHRGSEDRPAIVKILPPDDAKEKAKQEADDRAAKSQLEFYTVWISGASVFVALLQLVGILLQAFFLWKTIRLTRQSAEAATASANAATASANALLAIERGVLSERIAEQKAMKLFEPYELYPNSPAMWPLEVEFHVSLAFANTGRTEVTILETRGDVVFAESLPDIPATLPETAERVKRHVLGAGVESTGVDLVAKIRLDYEQSRKLAEGGASLFLLGEATFVDLFGDTVRHRFAWQYIRRGDSFVPRRREDERKKRH
ncbi:hypothetical protein [Methylosinus sp. PW1]|uniref:hypothetical protein n=1 Tax=Methylosinus sp. PW1 TaxID=107636 RepID=UPI000563A392|nr:hypothetical protein [Methylosinus sp. PW1]